MTESDSDKSLTEIPSVTAVSAQKLRINKAVNMKRSHASRMTAAQRAAKPGNNDFFASKNTLICKWCNKAVEHDRQSTVSRHMNSRSHQDNKKKNAKVTQKTLYSSLPVILETVSAELIVQRNLAGEFLNLTETFSSEEKTSHRRRSEKRRQSVHEVRKVFWGRMVAILHWNFFERYDFSTLKEH